MKKRFYKLGITLPTDPSPQNCVIIINDNSSVDEEKEIHDFFTELIETYHENHVDVNSYTDNGVEYDYAGYWEEIEESDFYELIDEGYEDLTESDVDY